MNNTTILLVDDETNYLQTARLILLSNGFSSVDLIDDSRKVIPSIQKSQPDLIVLDITMPHIAGSELLQMISDTWPHIPVIINTGINDISLAVTCMKQGARDFILKPFNSERFIRTIKTVLSEHQLEQENHRLREKLMTRKVENREAFSHIVSQSEQMNALFLYAEAVAHSNMPILILGETGTGKELMAKALHNLRNPEAPFVARNVAGIDDTFFSDTLFGHVKGAFTGAESSVQGAIAEAENGTLFLDEIGDLSQASQIKLLRFLQEREYYPVGSQKAKNANVFIIAASNRDLKNDPNFRRDLYYRLQSHQISLPPLRERTEDLPLLTDHFIQRMKPELTANQRDEMVKTFLHIHHTNRWEGNIRELEGTLCNFTCMPFSPISASEPMKTTSSAVHTLAELLALADHIPSIDTVRELIVKEVLHRESGNKSATAKKLGISRQTLLTVLADSQQ